MGTLIKLAQIFIKPSCKALNIYKPYWRTDVHMQNSVGLGSVWVWSWVTSSREHIHKRCGTDFLNHLFHLYCSLADYVIYNWSHALSFMLFLKIALIVSFSHDSGADSPTCSNGVTPTNKNKSHNKYTGVSSASSSPSSSPSSVNYSESNSTDSTKSQPHSATSNQETRSVLLLLGLVPDFEPERKTECAVECKQGQAYKIELVFKCCVLTFSRDPLCCWQCVFVCWQW